MTMNTRIRLALLAAILIATTAVLYLTTGPEAHTRVIAVGPPEIVLVGILLVLWVINPWLPRFEPYPVSTRFRVGLVVATIVSLAASYFSPGPAERALHLAVSVALLVFMKRRWFGRGPGMFAFFRDDTHI
jgi:hypothetical protein